MAEPLTLASLCTAICTVTPLGFIAVAGIVSVAGV